MFSSFFFLKYVWKVFLSSLTFVYLTRIAHHTPIKWADTQLLLLNDDRFSSF